MRKLVIIYFLCSICCVSCKELPQFLSRISDIARQAEPQNEPNIKYRLPDDIIPKEYRLHIVPYIEDVPPTIEPFTYHGKVEIIVLAKRATDKIIMHANHLKIYQVVIESVMDEENFKILNYRELPESHFMVIDLEKKLNANEHYKITAVFLGLINEDKEGFYRSSYVENGKKRWMFATHFVPIGARKAFPCFDEPALKAVFRLNLVIPPTWTALSNTEVESEQDASEMIDHPYFQNHRIVNFYPTYKMSTYSVAFAISHFAKFTSTTDKRFRIYSRPELIKSFDYAATLAPKALKFLEDVTKVKYTLPKLDQVAIPGIDPAETKNWGLLTYNEEALVYDKKLSSAEHIQYVTELIIHKIVHQWFGDLVSPKWWGNLWLNEGFATYLSSYVASHICPELETNMHFLTDQYYHVFQTDGLYLETPLVNDMSNSHSDVINKFGQIAYNKGGSIIRMIHNLMGEDNFWKGINAYLNEMKFSSADHNDLWRALSSAIPNGLLPENVEFKDVMNSWVLENGYPIVTVTRDYDTNSVTFSQIATAHYNTHNYWVPLTMLVQDAPKENANKVFWLHNETVTIHDISSDKWILVNNEKTGFYCVNYDVDNWRKLFKSINGTELVNTLSVNNRVQLLMDALTLPLNRIYKKIDYEIGLESTAYLNHETEYGPWAVVLDQIEMIQHRIDANKTTYLMGKIEHLYQHVHGFNLSLESDSLSLRLLRTRALRWMCSNGHKACNNDGLALFNEWRLNKKEIHPDLRQIVFAAGIRMGDHDTFEHLLNKYSVETDPVVITDILYGLGATKADNDRWRLLYESIMPNSTSIRKEHALDIIKVVASNHEGTDIALDFIFKNYDRAREVWGKDGAAFKVIAPLLYSEAQMQKFQEFPKSGDLRPMTRPELFSYGLAMAYVWYNLEWNREKLGSIVSFLSPKEQPEDNNNYNNSSSSLLASNTIVALALVLYFCHNRLL